MPAYPRRASTLLWALPRVLSLATLVACGGDPASPDAARPPGTDAFVPPGTDAGPLPDAFEPMLESDAFVPPDPDAGPSTVSFSADVMPILAACSGSGCHSIPQMFFLSPGRTGCASVTEQRFVVPGDPDASYVVHKLEGMAICGMRMPRGRTPLTTEQIGTIRTWIAEGARNN